MPVNLILFPYLHRFHFIDIALASSIVIYSTPRSSGSPSRQSGEAASADPKRSVRTILESESSSGQQETLDPDPLSRDKNAESTAADCLTVCQPHGSAEMRIENMASSSYLHGQVHAYDGSLVKDNVWNSKTGISRTDGASSGDATQPQSELGVAKGKTFFAEFSAKNRLKNENLVEYFRLPIPSKLHLRSHIAAKAKEGPRASVGNAERMSRMKGLCRPMPPPLNADYPHACAVIGPSRTLPQTRFLTLTSRSSRPYFLAPRNQESAYSKSELRNAPETAHAAIPSMKITNSKTALFSPRNNKSDAGLSDENLLAGVNRDFTDSSDSLLSCYLSPVLTKGR